MTNRSKKDAKRGSWHWGKEGISGEEIYVEMYWVQRQIRGGRQRSRKFLV